MDGLAGSWRALVPGLFAALALRALEDGSGRVGLGCDFSSVMVVIVRLIDGPATSGVVGLGCWIGIS